MQEKLQLGMKTPFGWKELTYDGLGPDDKKTCKLT